VSKPAKQLGDLVDLPLMFLTRELLCAIFFVHRVLSYAQLGLLWLDVFTCRRTTSFSFKRALQRQNQFPTQISPHFSKMAAVIVPVSLVIVPRGRIEDPPAPKIKIFSFAPAAGGCLPPLCNISALRNTFSILINIIYITLYLIIIIVHFTNIN